MSSLWTDLEKPDSNLTRLRSGFSYFLKVPIIFLLTDIDLTTKVNKQINDPKKERVGKRSCHVVSFKA